MASTFVTAVVAWFLLQALALVLRYGLRIRQLGLGWMSISIQTVAFNRQDTDSAY